MTTTKEILTEKLHKKLEDNSKARVHIERVEHDGNLLNDFIMPLGNNNSLTFYTKGPEVRMNLENGVEKDFSLHENAIYQIAEKLGIPPGYLQDLNKSNTEWQALLAAHILNKHDHTERRRVLVREVGGQVRGVLSDKYRRLNTSELYGNFIQGCQSKGLQIYDAYYNDLRSWVEYIHPQLIEVKTEGLKGLKVNDGTGSVFMAFGMRMSSSDFGNAAMDLRMFMMQVACLNGMVMESVMREIHLGSRIPDNIQVSKTTYMHDTKAMAGLIKDAVNSTMTKENIHLYARKISDATAKEIDYDKSFIQLAKVGMQKAEIESTKKYLIAGRSEDGITGEGSTLWKLIQGVGRVANDVELPSRKRELQEIAGNLMN